MKDELLLGITILSAGGTTTVPPKVKEALKLRAAPSRREKILWTLQGAEATVTKGTPQSSYKKTMLRTGDRTAVPRHAREAMRLNSTSENEERLLWIKRGDEVVVRKGTPQSIPTD